MRVRDPGRGVRSAQPALRLTRRGRTVVVVLVAALLLVAFSLGRVAPSASTTAPSPPWGQSGARPAPADPARSLVVRRGDTLWGIASAAAPSADPRVTVEQIIDLNRLSGPAVRVGQTLILPRGP